MRAFMSTPGDKPIYYEGDTLAYADGCTFKAPCWERDAVEAIRLATYAAEREARAILAETEPRTFLPVARFADKIRREGWLSPTAYVAGHMIEERQARTALADALRAFVTE
jgi:hypothetical protein